MVNVLITGGAGFIPSSLAEKLLNIGKYKVVLADNLLTGSIDNIPVHANCSFINCDVNDHTAIAQIMKAQHFDYVFHYAAVVGVLRTLENPVMVLKDIRGIENILNLSRETGVQRVFFSSSSEVYGEPVELPQNEHTTPLNSKLPYAIVKNLGEAFCRSYQQEYGLDFTIFRFFNTYGPKQSPDFVMSKFLRAALSNEEITIYGDGSQTRTFCYIDDNIDACINALNDPSTKNEVFNIGNDEPISILHLAQSVIGLTGSRSKIVHLPSLKEGDMTRRQPDITKMRQLLSRDLLSYEMGIQRVLDAWKN